MQELEYVFLDDDSLEYLESDERARTSYIDLLCLLHDLLAPFATDAEHPYFETNQVFRELADVVYAFSSHQQIGMAARANVETAQSFHSEFTRGRSKAPTKNPQAALDEFVSDLLKEYGVVRVIRSRGPVSNRA